MPELGIAELDTALSMLGDLLMDRGLSYEVVAIGGGGLLLLGLMIRTTKDLDLVALVDKGDFLCKTPPSPITQSYRRSCGSLALEQRLDQCRPCRSVNSRTAGWI